MTEMAAAVVLPCTTQEFGDFISGLLGKPQTIFNRVRGPFEVTREDVASVHALLVQRISQQNDAVLTQFTAKLIYTDNSSVLLNSIEGFLTYNEVRPVVCGGLHLSWTFLVKFRDKTHPEKQEIDLSFLSGRSSSIFDQDSAVIVLDGSGGTGVISYRIAHTARTWGADIDALLNSHVKTVVDDIPPWRKWLAKHEVKIGILVFCALFLASIAGAFASSSSFVHSQRTQVDSLNAISSLSVTPAQMSYLLETIASGAWERFLLTSVAFLLFSFVVSIGVGVWAGSTADNLPPSFLLLTKESERHRRKTLASNRNKLISFAASIASGLFIGIAGNVCYGLWFERLITP